jgi:N-methylhydantoinase A/oxoprolinase/acetone carboxylase beta subunit
VRIGIDVGGTNTDAVLMDGDRVMAAVKRPTSRDVTTGIQSALDSLLADSGVAPAAIRGVMIGTTHFTNAVVEARRLLEVGVVRLGLPATLALRPTVDWPPALKRAIGDHVYLCHGGHEFDGRELAPLDPGELRRVAEDIAGRGLRAVAISSVFSPVNAEFEQEAAAIIAEHVPDVAISLSTELGRIGLLERENATVLNACLADLAHHIADAFRESLLVSGIHAPVFLSQNDGTLMTVDFAERYPVATFASGPTNSMRGAALLSGENDCAVIDIGGTTADIGMLVAGYPREAQSTVEIGGVRTNFRMPDVLPLGIGGGSRVTWDGDDVMVGPQSVGYALIEEGLVFGGDVLTASDVAVAAGQAEMGDPSRVAHLDQVKVAATLRHIETRIAETVDRMKLVADDIPVVVVGGGSVLLGDHLDGASRVLRPAHASVANAVGAAIAQVGGETDQLFSIGADLSRDAAIEQARDQAAARAVAAGARPESIRIVDVEELALAYVPGNAVRIRVKAVGDLDLDRLDAGAAS